MYYSVSNIKFKIYLSTVYNTSFLTSFFMNKHTLKSWFNRLSYAKPDNYNSFGSLIFISALKYSLNGLV